MSTQIDLSRLPAPDIVQRLHFEAELDLLKADLTRRFPDAAPVLALETEPLVKLLQVFAYGRTLLIGHVNDAARAVILATAKGADLDNLAAIFGVERFVLVPADAAANPPVAEVREDDEGLRRRTQLALEGFSTAGPRAAYEFHALSADPRVKSVAVDSPAPGVVRVVVLAREGAGEPPADLLAAVGAALNVERVRPLCDTVTVSEPVITPFSVVAGLEVGSGPDPLLVLAKAQEDLANYLLSTHTLGGVVSISGLHAALHQPGVVRVHLTAPLADIVPGPGGAAYCTDVSVQIIGGEG